MSDEPEISPVPEVTPTEHVEPEIKQPLPEPITHDDVPIQTTINGEPYTLPGSNHKTLLLPTASVTPEILERLGEDAGTILCISAMPPFVFTQTRTLCQRIREQLPENRILVALWQSIQSPETMRERFGSARPDRVVTTLAAAMVQIERWQKGDAARVDVARVEGAAAREFAAKGPME